MPDATTLPDDALAVEPPAEPVPPADPPTDPEGLGDAGKRALDAERRRAAEAEKRAKAAEKRAEELETANLNEVDRAIKEAADAARVDERKKVAASVVAAKFEATGVKPEALALVDLAKFVNDDGTVDSAAIADAAKHLAPPTAGPGSADAGPQGQPPQDPTLDERIAAAEKAGDVMTVIALQNQKLAPSRAG